MPTDPTTTPSSSSPAASGAQATLPQPPPPFLDVPTLLEASLPRTRAPWFWYLAALFAVAVLVGGLAERGLQQGGGTVLGPLATLAMLGLLTALAAMTWSAGRAAQREQLRLEAVEELVQLRRWSEAAAVLDALLSSPVRLPPSRTRALVYLGTVLARYHRFDDAIRVYEHLLDNELLDEDSASALKLGRAMALLREDRLFDADRAIAELRRSPRVGRSAGLTMVELYRDVKTGHPQEAIELFEARRSLLSRQLGHRFGDACALAARAYDLLGRADEARAAYADATVLTPEVELHRRWPEVAALAGRYEPTPSPMSAEAGGEADAEPDADAGAGEGRAS